MKRYRLGLCALGFASALLASTGVLAGFRSAQQVVIADAERLANGDLGYVANTADTTQYIGCYSLGVSGSCYARDRTGLARSCSTSDSTLLAVIRSLNGDSYLTFWWDTSGRCTSIRVDNGSLQVPKK
jgi:hypothetical protein